MERDVYFDHHATTPCHPDVVEAMLPFFSDVFGNPASIQHAPGRRAATALEEARSTVADFFEARPNEVYFTSGATESNNIVLNALEFAQGERVVTSAIEHKSVLEPAKRLRARGAEVVVLQPDRDGLLSIEGFARAIVDKPRLVSIIAANGEIGTVQDIELMAQLCHERKVRFHSDATQAVGKVPIDLGLVPLISISAHKIYGPKGVGALIARGPRPRPLLLGGGQEKGVRSGTVNVAGAVGLARALELRKQEMGSEASRLTALRERLRQRIVSEIADVVIHGSMQRRLPGNLNVSFLGIDSESLLTSIRGFALSSGSACSSGDREPSHVLLAIGASEEEAMSSIRFGLGRSTTEREVDSLVDELRSAVARVRGLTPTR